jgi:hypothetical protein
MAAFEVTAEAKLARFSNFYWRWRESEQKLHQMRLLDEQYTRTASVACRT